MSRILTDSFTLEEPNRSERQKARETFGLKKRYPYIGTSPNPNPPNEKTTSATR